MPRAPFFGWSWSILRLGRSFFAHRCASRAFGAGLKLGCWEARLLGAAAGGAPAASAASAITATTVFTWIVAPSGNRVSRTIPETGDGISASTLSVEISKSGSSFSIASPGFLSQRVIVPSKIDSPIWGIVTSIGIGDPHSKVGTRELWDRSVSGKCAFEQRRRFHSTAHIKALSNCNSLHLLFCAAHEHCDASVAYSGWYFCRGAEYARLIVCRHARSKHESVRGI